MRDLGPLLGRMMFSTPTRSAAHPPLDADEAWGRAQEARARKAAAAALAAPAATASPAVSAAPMPARRAGHRTRPRWAARLVALWVRLPQHTA